MFREDLFLYNWSLQFVVGVGVDGNLAQDEGHYLNLLEVRHLARVLSEGVEQSVLYKEYQGN